MKILPDIKIQFHEEELKRGQSSVEIVNNLLSNVEIGEGVIHVSSTDLWFENCIIHNMDVFAVCHPDHFYFNKIWLLNCKILDYEKIIGIENCVIEDCIFVKPVPLVCPESGEFVAYKKCWYGDSWYGDKKNKFCVVKLRIPAGAKRSSAFGRKCRCSKAYVLGIYDLDGKELKDIKMAFSHAYSIDYDTTYNYILCYIHTKYIKYDTVIPDSFDENRYKECSHGIHFFMTFEEAAAYDFT